MDNKSLKKLESDLWEAADLLRSNTITTSVKDLIGKLQGNLDSIFTLIQKFNSPNLPPISPNHVIILCRMGRIIAASTAHLPRTRAIVDVQIRDALYNALPATFSDEAIQSYRHDIYEYMYTSIKKLRSSIT